MRIAMVEVLGYIIRELAGSSEDNADFKQTQKQINGLFDLLHERALDTSSYVRTKVFSVLSRIFDIKAPKFPKQRLDSTRIAVESLEDKASTVRKSAISLLTKLLITHPYGMMHGGTLQAEIWEAEYETVKTQLRELEDKIGKAVEMQGEEEAEEKEDDGDEGVDEDKKGSPRERKKSKKWVDALYDISVYLMFYSRGKIRRDEDAMDVDEGGDEKASTEGDSHDEDEDGDSMSVDDKEEISSLQKRKGKKPKAPKLKPRKSELNLEALAQEQQALSSLEADEHLHLKLKRKYYAEATTFTRLLGDAMENLKKLLGSTNKAEVLETMEFFRVAHEYRLKDAEVSIDVGLSSIELTGFYSQEGIQKMIHLIWTKDNNTSVSGDGEELKGIRQRLLEVYSSLYFEVPEGDVKSQVNRIARNLIEWV